MTIELTNREAQIAAAKIDGATNAEIANDLGISVHTVKWHWRQVLDRANMPTVPLLIQMAGDVDHGAPRGASMAVNR